MWDLFYPEQLMQVCGVRVDQVRLVTDYLRVHIDKASSSSSFFISGCGMTIWGMAANYMHQSSLLIHRVVGVDY